jgi:hypothetical protein
MGHYSSLPLVAFPLYNLPLEAALKRPAYFPFDTHLDILLEFAVDLAHSPGLAPYQDMLSEACRLQLDPPGPVVLANLALSQVQASLFHYMPVAVAYSVGIELMAVVQGN